MSQTPAISRSDMYLRFGIVGLGMVVFVLLFFADKTNLSNKPRAEITETGSSATNLLSALPPMNDPASLALKAAADTAPPAARVMLLDSLVSQLERTGQFAQAAVYADQLTQLDSTAAREFTAGNLARRATQLQLIRADSLIYRQLSDLAMRHLEQANTLSPNEEATLLNLGLAYTESNLPANFMKGVLTIRQVLSVNPDNLEANFRLGVFSEQSGQLEKAVQRYEKVLAVQPDDQDARFRLARVQFQLGQIAQAQANLKAVIAQTDNPELKTAAEAALQQIGPNN